MKQYVEAREIIPPDAGDDYVEEFIRLEVVTTVEDAVNDIKTMLDPDKDYNIYRHDCYHDEGKQCLIETIVVDDP